MKYWGFVQNRLYLDTYHGRRSQPMIQIWRCILPSSPPRSKDQNLFWDPRDRQRMVGWDFFAVNDSRFPFSDTIGVTWDNDTRSVQHSFRICLVSPMVSFHDFCFYCPASIAYCPRYLISKSPPKYLYHILAYDISNHHTFWLTAGFNLICRQHLATCILDVESDPCNTCNEQQIFSWSSV